MRSVRAGLDAYIAWREHQFMDTQLRVLRLTAEVFVMRDGKIAERRAWVIPLAENDFR